MAVTFSVSRQWHPRYFPTTCERPHRRAGSTAPMAVLVESGARRFASFAEVDSAWARGL